MLTKQFRKQWISRADLYFFFFLSIIFSANAHFASIIHHQHSFYTYKEKKNKAGFTDCHCELISFVLLMSDHQFLFGFVCLPFLLLWKMWQIIDGREWRWGGVERFGRVTVNTPKSLHHVKVFTWDGMYIFQRPRLLLPNVKIHLWCHPIVKSIHYFSGMDSY